MCFLLRYHNQYSGSVTSFPAEDILCLFLFIERKCNSTGNAAHYSVITYTGKESEKEWKYVYV